MPDFGGGIYLTKESDLEPSWDLAIDTSGDIKTTDGESELQKDVSYSTAVRAGNLLGSRLTPVVMNRIENRARNALIDEQRIDSILIVEAEEVDDNTVEIVAQANANQENIELIFEVTL